jgi:hypothetical protein
MSDTSLSGRCVSHARHLETGLKDNARREVLTQDQIDFYNENSYLIVENQIPDDVIANIRTKIARFEEEVRGLTVSNDRLDLEDSHSPEAPRIRRIKLPHTISDVMLRVI